MVVFQCHDKNATEDDNYFSLTSELQGLALADFILEKMVDEAASKSVKFMGAALQFLLIMILTRFLDIVWNRKDAFIGKFGSSDSASESSTTSTEQIAGPMIYSYFLAVPLLKIDDEENIEVRFGINSRVNTWPLMEAADIVACFAHYAFLKSDQKRIFTDLQGAYIVSLVKPQWLTSV
jgi:hypothetical protein